MTSISTTGGGRVDPNAERRLGNPSDTKWSEIDKTRLYLIGTGLYSFLTVALHPLTVIKIRKQVGVTTPELPTSIISSSESVIKSNIHQYYRGLGVVISLAIPTRIIYISVLESSRERIESNAREIILNPPASIAKYNNQLQSLLPFVTPFSGGVAGGLAAVSSQMIVVPMDVISQKQMVMNDSTYKHRGSALHVVKSVVANDGWSGIYRGFGLSLFTSLPAGSIWWATYAGCKDQMNAVQNTAFDSIPALGQQGIIQVSSAFSAALAASILTQPLDTIKTRLQVKGGASKVSSKSAMVVSVFKELTASSGLSGMYQGLLPRVTHMGVWGSILSAAFEYLKVVSRKDYNA